jgi:hypothetical protein
MASERIGSVRGYPVSWDRASGEVWVSLPTLFSREWRRAPYRANSASVALEIADAYLRSL